MAQQWFDVGSDSNWIEYGGQWARHIQGSRYHVIRFENCEEWGDGATGYHCELKEVDIESPQLGSALHYIGFPHDGKDDYGDVIERFDLVKAQALAEYGAYAPLWQDSGTNARKLIRAARRESRLLASDSAKYEAAMNRPVNRIGSTAREYQAGDIQSAIGRGLAAGDVAAEIMLKMGTR